MIYSSRSKLEFLGKIYKIQLCDIKVTDKVPGETKKETFELRNFVVRPTEIKSVF